MNPQLEPGAEISLRDPKTDRSLGTWSLRGRLAKGGQGIVHTVEDARGRLGVLKVPSPQGLISMEVERRILLKLPPHRNVVRVLGITTLSGVDCPVFAYAYQNPFVRLGSREVKDELSRHAWGPTTDQRVGLPATTAIEMIQELCAALEHIHRHGFVHGDIKPANILVEIDSGRSQLSNRDYFDAIQRRAFNTILVDFGSTRGTAFLDDHDEADTRVVPSEFTPLYAPPEAFLPEGKLGTSVDVYQVGLLLYQFLTGRLPYEHHVAPESRRALVELSGELLALKREEAAGKLTGWDTATIESASLEDVFFAESYQSQRLRDRFCQDVVTLVRDATSSDPAARPSVAAFRAQLLRLFELEPPRRGGKGRSHVSLRNPRWHLRRTNRLARAGQALDEPEPLPPPRPRPQPKPTPKKPPSHDPNASTTSWEVAEQAQVDPEATLDSFDEPAPRPPRPSRRLARRAPPGRSAVVGPLSGVRVALIDDDKVALAVLGSALRKRGCKVGTFRDPESALEVVAGDHPDALIVDMQMPGIGGPELVRRLAQRLNGLPFPVLVLSSLEREEALQDAFRAGVSDYLVKPCSEGELAVKLEQALSRHQTSPLPEVPIELGGFEVGEEMFRGELASVYQALDPWADGAGGPYAVKVLRPELVGEAAPLLQLRREVDVLAAVDHSSLPRLLRSGLVGGLLYYVTGEVPLLSLGQEVRETGTLGADELVGLLEDAGGALVALHAQGLLLGRLTPEGLGRLSNGRVMITDLAHTRRLGPVAREDEPELSRSRYSGPELFEDPPVPDFSSDVYALGAVAIELYAGRPAVRSRSTQRVNVQALGKDLPAPLRDVLEHMLEPQLGARLTSAGLLAEVRRAVGPTG